MGCLIWHPNGLRFNKSHGLSRSWHSASAAHPSFPTHAECESPLHEHLPCGTCARPWDTELVRSRLNGPRPQGNLNLGVRMRVFAGQGWMRGISSSLKRAQESFSRQETRKRGRPVGKGTPRRPAKSQGRRAQDRLRPCTLERREGRGQADAGEKEARS